MPITIPELIRPEPAKIMTGDTASVRLTVKDLLYGTSSNILCTTFLSINY